MCAEEYRFRGDGLVWREQRSRRSVGRGPAAAVRVRTVGTYGAAHRDDVVAGHAHRAVVQSHLRARFSL